MIKIKRNRKTQFGMLVRYATICWVVMIPNKKYGRYANLIHISE